MNDQVGAATVSEPTASAPAELTLGPVPPGVKGAELHQLLVDAANGKGISPEKLEMFGTLLQVPLPEQKPLVPSTTAAWVAGGCFAGYLVTNALIGAFPELHQLPVLNAEVPVRLLDAFNNIISFTSDATSGSDVAAALPYVLKYLALISGSGFLTDTVGKLFANNTQRTRTEQIRSYNEGLTAAHQELTSKVEAQALPLKMNSGHTAAFTGAGDPTLEGIREKLSVQDAMEYTSSKTHNTISDFLPTQLLPDKISPEELATILDHGDFRSAGEIFISPIKSSETFLAHLPDDFDMDCDQVESLINQLDEYCRAQGIENKRVIIAANPQSMSVLSKTIINGETVSTEVTLEQIMAEKTKERKAAVDFVNPDELVMSKILFLAKGRRLGFHAREAGTEKYSERFNKIAETVAVKSGYVQNADDDLIVIYNIDDSPTTVDAKLPEQYQDKEKVAVITDPKMKNVLLARGYSEDHIVVVPELVRDTILAEVEKS
jgi:hypothetical protein